MKQGKVRDIIDEGDTLCLVCSDRISVFDRYVGDIPGKGIVLNNLSAWWFEQTQGLVANHFLNLVSPRSMRVKKCQPLAIEVVVRGYLTGSTNTSLWTLYQQGARAIFGTTLPEGLQKNTALPELIMTPTTKSNDHDKPLTPDDILAIPLMTAALWAEITDKAKTLFRFASRIAEQRGLILADTKYEFGLDADQKLCLIDEIHTPDSSRFWDATDWEQARLQGREPYAYDKEMLRLWYRQQGDPYALSELPPPPAEIIADLKQRYETVYQKITTRSIACVASSV